MSSLCGYKHWLVSPCYQFIHYSIGQLYSAILNNNYSINNELLVLIIFSLNWIVVTSLQIVFVIIIIIIITCNILFLLATEVTTTFIFHDPSQLSSLQDNGLPWIILNSLINKKVKTCVHFSLCSSIYLLICPFLRSQ